MIEWLYKIYNMVWRTGVAPADWQRVIIVPIHKKCSQRKCGNNIIEEVIRQLVEKHLEKRKKVFTSFSDLKRPMTRGVEGRSVEGAEGVCVVESNMCIVFCFWCRTCV